MGMSRPTTGRSAQLLALLMAGGTSVLAPAAEGLPAPPPSEATAPAAPLPGPAWTDPDSVNWIEVTADAGKPQPPPQPRILERIADRRIDTRPALVPTRPTAAGLAERIRGRLRGEGRIARAISPDAGGHATGSQAALNDGWPTPESLLDQLEPLATPASGSSAAWSDQTLELLDQTLRTDGPADPAAAAPLLSLGEAAAAGVAVADAESSPQAAGQLRRAALAVARRAAVWRAAAAWCTAEAMANTTVTANDVAVKLSAGQIDPRVNRLLAFIERYESSGDPLDASAVKATLAGIAVTATPPAVALARAVSEHYHAPNVRVAVHRAFVERMLPETTISKGTFQDFILGRPVRGRRTVEQTLGVRFVPHAGEICMELVVNGQVAARSISESGPVTVHATSQATFTVAKPVHLTPSGLVVGEARGTARSRNQLADIETSFDSVPIMGSIVRSIARNQHDEVKADANRESSGKIVSRACQEVDKQADPKLDEMAERIRTRLWRPLVNLGLEPTPVALETTEDVASLRLRLAAESQLAAHTPRPRAPADALLSMQLHETAANNALGRLALAGRRLELPDLFRLVCEKLGMDPRVPQDLPEGVAITFAAGEPLRVQCRAGLVHVRVALDALEYGRRNWYDLAVHVAYRPVAAGPQIYLEREGPVQISGPGHEGRMEIALRLIFGKIFAKERLVPVLPDKVAENPRLAGVRVVQAAATEGWLGIALAEPAGGDSAGADSSRTSPTARAPMPADGRVLRR